MKVYIRGYDTIEPGAPGLDPETWETTDLDPRRPQTQKRPGNPRFPGRCR
jgi:hypothetical protein